MRRRKEVLVLMFVDCKAACDLLDRGKVVGAIRESVTKGLVMRCVEVLREIKGKVRMGERESGGAHF